jgi:2-C-methyl-D-erythritol 4-phosphate cytidylyltransferase
MNNSVVIVLAGNSTRFGQAKQFFPVKGKPLVSYTISAFNSHPLVDEIILVIRQEDEEELKQIIKEFGFNKVRKMVYGGETRAESVRNGLDAISFEKGKVLIHDGARPLVREGLISRIIEELDKSKCVVPFLLQEDATYSLSKNNYVDRHDLFRIQTPQAFRIEVIKKVFKDHFDPKALDEASMYRPFGEIGFIQGDKQTLKVTTKDDIALIEAYLKQQ